MAFILILCTGTSLLVGAVGLSLAAWATLRLRDPALLAYWVILFAYMLYLIALHGLGLLCSLSPQAPQISLAIVSVISLACLALLFILIVFFFRRLFRLPGSPLRELPLYLVFLAFPFVVLYGTGFLGPYQRQEPAFWTAWIYVIATIIVVVYALAVIVWGFRRISPALLPLIKKTGISLGLFGALSLLDLWRPGLLSSIVAPLFLAILSTLLAHHALGALTVSLHAGPSQSGLPVLDGELSPREEEVARLIIRGIGNRAISERLYISVNTVKTHIKSIMAKTGAANRMDLLLMLDGQDRELEPPPGPKTPV